MMLIDTNVLLRSAQPSHTQHAVAVAAVKATRMRGSIPCIVPQVIYEYWVVATRPVSANGLGMSVAEAEAEVEQLCSQFHCFRDERAIFDRWQRLVAQYNVQGKTAHDARLVAAMERHGINQLLTFNDQDFRRFTHITVIHPASIAIATT